jgi:hypothetical protein
MENYSTQKRIYVLIWFPVGNGVLYVMKILDILN